MTLTPDELGRISFEDEVTSSGHRVRSYTYYPNGQLHEVFENSALRELYAYDDNGNRRMASIDGVMSIGTYDDQDRLSTYGDWSFTYDLDDRLETRTRGISENWGYGYDFRGNLLRVDTPSNDTIEYVVDGRNRRIARKVNGVRTHAYIYRGLQLVGELDENNQVRSQFVYGALRHVPIAMRRGGTWYVFVLDPRGSIRQVVNTSTGEIAQVIEYDAFGRVLVDTNPGFQPFGFAGGLYEHETGWERFGARDYDPEVGRWTAMDPILFAGGSANLYTYCKGDPVNFIDPTGLVVVAGDELAEQLIEALAWKEAGYELLSYLDASPYIYTVYTERPTPDDVPGMFGMSDEEAAVCPNPDADQIVRILPGDALSFEEKVVILGHEFGHAALHNDYFQSQTGLPWFLDPAWNEPNDPGGMSLAPHVRWSFDVAYLFSNW